MSRETDIEATAWLKHIHTMITTMLKDASKVFVSHMRHFVTENLDSPPGCHLSLK